MILNPASWSMMPSGFRFYLRRSLKIWKDSPGSAVAGPDRVVIYMLRSEVKNAIFGLFDGLTVVLGVIIGLYPHHPDLIFKSALCVGVAEALGMGAAEWLSETKSGIHGPLTIGISTLLGTALPALPFLFLSKGTSALIASTIFLIAAIVIATARAQDRKFVRSGIETVLILTIVSACVWLISM